MKYSKLLLVLCLHLLAGNESNGPAPLSMDSSSTGVDGSEAFAVITKTDLGPQVKYVECNNAEKELDSLNLEKLIGFSNEENNANPLTGRSSVTDQYTCSDFESQLHSEKHSDLEIGSIEFMKKQLDDHQKQMSSHQEKVNQLQEKIFIGEEYKSRDVVKNKYKVEHNYLYLAFANEFLDVSAGEVYQSEMFDRNNLHIQYDEAIARNNVDQDEKTNASIMFVSIYKYLHALQLKEFNVFASEENLNLSEILFSGLIDEQIKIVNFSYEENNKVIIESENQKYNSLVKDFQSIFNIIKCKEEESVLRSKINVDLQGFFILHRYIRYSENLLLNNENDLSNLKVSTFLLEEIKFGKCQIEKEQEQERNELLSNPQVQNTLIFMDLYKRDVKKEETIAKLLGINADLQNQLNNQKEESIESKKDIAELQSQLNKKKDKMIIESQLKHTECFFYKLDFISNRILDKSKNIFEIYLHDITNICNETPPLIDKSILDQFLKSCAQFTIKQKHDHDSIFSMNRNENNMYKNNYKSKVHYVSHFLKILYVAKKDDLDFIKLERDKALSKIKDYHDFRSDLHAIEHKYKQISTFDVWGEYISDIKKLCNHTPSLFNKTVIDKDIEICERVLKENINHKCNMDVQCKKFGKCKIEESSWHHRLSTYFIDAYNRSNRAKGDINWYIKILLEK